MKIEFSRQIFEKYSNTKFHENLSSGSRVVSCGRTDMTKLIVAFVNFANWPKETLCDGCLKVGVRSVTCSSSKLTTPNSGVTCEPLHMAALAARCTRSYAHLVRNDETCNTDAEYIPRFYTQFSFSDYQISENYASLL
jgi:hypothetical protein